MTIILIPDNGRNDIGSVVLGLDGIQRGVVRIVPMRVLEDGRQVCDYTGVLHETDLPTEGTYWYKGLYIDRDTPKLAPLPQIE